MCSYLRSHLIELYRGISISVTWKSFIAAFIYECTSFSLTASQIHFYIWMQITHTIVFINYRSVLSQKTDGYAVRLFLTFMTFAIVRLL